MGLFVMYHYQRTRVYSRTYQYQVDICISDAPWLGQRCDLRALTQVTLVDCVQRRARLDLAVEDR